MIKSGLWRTDTGSELSLDITQPNIVTGYFQTQHGHADFTKKYPLTGFVNDPLIGFVVSWEDTKSITSWTGIHGTENDRECIHAVWHLGREFKDSKQTEKNEYWEAFVTFTGTYFRVTDEQD